MALQTPVLNPITSFDASQDKEYTFNVSGGDAWQGVVMTILNNTNPSATPIKSYTFVGDVDDVRRGVIKNNLGLVNGVQYQATIQTTTATSLATVTTANSSKTSKPIVFYCYTTPTFEFINFSSIVSGSSQVFNIAYTQAEGEYLSSYRIRLYDGSNTLLKDTGILSAPSQDVIGDAVFCNIAYTVDGLMNGDIRKIEVDGTTMQGAIVSIPKTQFQVQYQEVDKYTEIYVQNNCDNGNITVGNKIDVMGGYAYKEPVEYYPKKELGEQANLRDNGAVWTDVIDANNFSVFLRFRAPVHDIPHLILTSNGAKISESIIGLSDIKSGYVYKNIQVTTNVFDDNGNIIDAIVAEYDLSHQELPDVNYTTDATEYGLLVRRANGVLSTELSMLKEPIEGLSSHYIYTSDESGTIQVIDTTGDGDIQIIFGLEATDAQNDGNIVIQNISGVPILDLYNDGTLYLGSYTDNSWLTAIRLQDDRSDVPIIFSLGSDTSPKDREDLEEDDTYLWAITDDSSINLSENNFEIINDILYYYPDGKET